MLSQTLGTNDFNHQFIHSGEQAMPKLQRNEVDLVYIDINSNQKDGFEICRRIKSDPVSEAIPVIFIAESRDTDLIGDFFDSGGDDYLLKPLNEKELLKKAMFHIELNFSRRMSKDINHILEKKIAERTIELEESLVRLNKAKKELESLDIAKTEFLNLISHEIRTPLNGIMGSLALIGRYHFTDDVNRYFSLLDTSVKRLEMFSNTILEASNLRLKGEKALVFMNVDPVKVVNEVIDLCSGNYSAKEIEVNLKSLPDNLLIQADIKYFKECLIAVIDNAFKFSPERGSITIALNYKANGFLIITVSDQGPGFSKDSLENIFAPLSNLKNHYDKNTGMGLHLARLIAEAHSGSISVRNIETKGAEIEILIPVMH